MNDSYCKQNFISQGVDLNRNYDFHFGENKEDSEPCSETFNGNKAFSEPETLAIKGLLEKYDSISSAMNFHAYGNMWIRPFNYSSNKLLVKRELPEIGLIKQYQFFNDIIKKVTPSAMYGNAISTVYYRSFGEASDYMLGRHGIFAFSPELGSGKQNS